MAETTTTIGRRMVVRPGATEDVEWIVEELRQFAAWVERKHLLFAEAYTREWMPRLIADHFVRVAEVGGERAGVIAALVGAHPINPSLRTLTELFWWVSLDHRASRAGLLLLEAFVEWGRMHADWVLLSLEADSPVKEKTLVRRGFMLKERGYLLET